MSDPAREGAKSERDEAVAALHKNCPEFIKFARRLGADDPEDTTDEAFSQLIANWDRLRDTNKALAWMRTVVRRLTCKQFRELERQRDLVRLLGLDLTTTTQVAFDLVLNEDQRAVFDAVLALPQQQCLIIVLQFWHDLSITEIAQELRIRQKTVRTHNRRAIAKLRKTLGELR